MDEKNTVIEAIRNAGEPVNASKVAELTGLDKKIVDKVFAQLKKDGTIVSPVRPPEQTKRHSRNPAVPFCLPPHPPRLGLLIKAQ